MRPGIFREDVPTGEGRRFRAECERLGVSVVHECPTAGGKTVFLTNADLRAALAEESKKKAAEEAETKRATLVEKK